MSIALHLDGVSKKFRLGSSNDYGRLTEAIARSILGVFKGTERGTGSVPAEYQSRLREGWFWALEDIELRVSTGEVVGIVGRNGAGKSTLLKLLSRIIQPTTGRVGVKGRVGSLLEVGTGFHPELTGRENVFLNGAILGMSRIDIRKRFDQIVSFAEVEEFLDTPVKRYSSGMAVRLAFSVAAHLEPDVLIIDEVLAVGDQAFQQKCMTKAGELGRSGKTVLIVSHNLASVANLCTRAVLLRDGKVRGDGEPAQIIDLYLKESIGISGMRDWGENGPQTDRIRLQKVWVASSSTPSIPAGEIDIDQSIHIVVEYEVIVDGTTVAPSIKVKDEMASYVFWSSNAPSMCLDTDPLYQQRLKKGTYRAVCTIPANFFNETRYFVSVSLGMETGDADIAIESVLSFLIKDTGAMRKEYHGPWVGPCIRPRLDWKSTEVY